MYDFLTVPRRSFPPAKRRPIANVDLAWLRMDEPSNRMVVTALLTFDQPPDFDRLRATLERRLLCFPRFRQRVVVPAQFGRRPRWETDPELDLSFHLRRIVLPPPADEACLRRLVGELMSVPLDPARPLWQFHWIENYGRGGAVLARIHHAVADGVALMNVLLSLTDEEPGRARSTYGGRTVATGDSLTSLLGAARSRWGMTRRMTRLLFGRGLETALHPGRFVELARAGAEGVATAGRLLARSADPETALRGELGVAKRVSWSPPVPLADVKAIGRVTGSTVNDVLLAAMTGALRRYLEQRGEEVAGLDLHAAVPVNLRSRQDLERLGNRFGLVFLSLPVGITDPLDRLFELRRRMNALKGSSEAAVTFGILGALGLASSRLQKAFVDFMGAKNTLVMTNVPGPRRTVYLAGAALRGVMFWVPQSGHVGLGVSILSYAGEVRLGLVSDAGLVPDPERLAAAFGDELEALMELVYLTEAA